jgi:hypothetical protein
MGFDVVLEPDKFFIVFRTFPSSSSGRLSGEKRPETAWHPRMVRKASEPDLIGDIHRVVVKGAPKVDDVIRGRQLVTLLRG